jgi:hypothetical protein
MSFRNPAKAHERPAKAGSMRGRILFLGLLAVMIGGFITESWYVHRHRPLIAAELAEADRQASALIEEISAPPGSTLTTPLEKSVGTPNFKSKWHGINNSLNVVATLDVPGTPAQVSQWYRERLPDQGWHSSGPLSEMYSRWEREKWMLTVEHNEWWGGSDAHVRVRVRLYWHYGRTHVSRANRQ